MFFKENNPTKLWRYSAYALLAITAITCMVSIGLHAYFGLNNDNTTLIYQTRQMLAGQSLYKDLFEVAPPFIHFLYVPPVLFTGVTGIPIEYTLDIYVALLIVMSLGLISHIVRTRYGRLDTAIILAPVAVAYCIYSFYAEVYADREHLVIILMLPYIFLQAPWFETARISKKMRFFMGVLAGIASVLKPYYVIIPAFICLYNLIRTRNWRTLFSAENWGVAASVLAFIFTILFITPYYTKNVLPVALEVYKGSLPAFSVRMRHLRVDYFSYVPWFILSFSVMALAAGFRKNIASVSFFLVLLAATAFVFYINSGWYYTYYPLYALSFLTFLYLFYLIVTTPLPSMRFTPAMQRATLGILAVTIMLPCWAHFTGGHIARTIVKQIAHQERTGYPLNYTVLRPEVKTAFGKYLKPGEGVTLYSTETWATNLLQIADVVSDSRFDCIWQLPGVIKAEKENTAPFTRTFFFNALASDLKEKKPAVVFVEQSPTLRKLPTNFDILAFFRRHDIFEQEWKNYHLAEQVNVCADSKKKMRCSYGIYVRNDAPKAAMFSEDAKKNKSVD